MKRNFGQVGRYRIVGGDVVMNRDAGPISEHFLHKVRRVEMEKEKEGKISPDEAGHLEEYRALRGGRDVWPAFQPGTIWTKEDYSPTVYKARKIPLEELPVVMVPDATWKAMTEGIGREPTHGEHIRFLTAMRKSGWVTEANHVQKVRHLQNQIKDEHNENLVLRSFIDELKEMIVVMRAKIVEQDEVLGKMAVVNSKGN